MISVVCVYNNEDTLGFALLSSLRQQSAEHQLILLDNRQGAYGSAARAPNEGGRRASADYIMFVHQDMWLGSSDWLSNAEGILRTLPSLGVAGVAGMTDAGRNWNERVRFSINMLGDAMESERGRVRSPTVVQTLDECVLIVPRPVFQEFQFDEETFDGWDCYGADYCLAAGLKGLKAYVLPLPSSHCCSRASYPIWKFPGLLKYQKRLYAKHKARYGRLHTWMGTVSWLGLKQRSAMGVLGPLYLRLLPNTSSILRSELSGCRTVLDLGCGHRSPLLLCNVPHSLGVELFEPSLLESRRTRIHSQYILGDITRIAFKPKSFDAVIAVEVLEHLSEADGIELIHRMEQWASRKVIITTPNGHVEQDAYDNNPLQRHRSGWGVEALRGLGFRVRGSGGLRVLRGYRGQVKYRPPFLWERASDLSQPLVRAFPDLAFQLVATKQLTSDST